jgi:organic hydroperoxide reductase OsmC/OhrA
VSAPRLHRYEGRLVWTGAARGPIKTYASYSREYEVAFPGKPVLRGSADPAFRGDASLHNPEELLVAALSSCHCLSYLALAALAGIVVTAYEDAATGTMEETRGAGRFTDVLLRPTVTIASGAPADVEKARALHEGAHATCFIAASVNFPVRCEPSVVVAPSSSS